MVQDSHIKYSGICVRVWHKSLLNRIPQRYIVHDRPSRTPAWGGDRVLQVMLVVVVTELMVMMSVVVGNKVLVCVLIGL